MSISAKAYGSPAEPTETDSASEASMDSISSLASDDENFPDLSVDVGSEQLQTV
ncbi:MAG: hypothetical protein V2I33_25910 [Kangiellaceae bacterium]|nr:hypothetical protein [Kangiellaceae bacterium]